MYIQYYMSPLWETISLRLCKKYLNIINILSNLKNWSGFMVQNWGSYEYYSYKMSTFKKKVRVRLKWHLITTSPCNPDSFHSQRKSFPSVPLKDTDIWWRVTLDWAWALQMSLSSFITVTLVDMSNTCSPWVASANNNKVWICLSRSSWFLGPIAILCMEPFDKGTFCLIYSLFEWFHMCLLYWSIDQLF